MVQFEIEFGGGQTVLRNVWIEKREGLFEAWLQVVLDLHKEHKLAAVVSISPVLPIERGGKRWE